MEKCKTCNRTPQPDCDWNQGRCPHLPSLFDIQPKDTSRGHFYVSMAKSSLRILAGVFLLQGALVRAGSAFILAEFLGILEELV